MIIIAITIVYIIIIACRWIVNLLETSSPSYYPSSSTGAIVLFRTISSRKIINSPFQDPQSSPISHGATVNLLYIIINVIITIIIIIIIISLIIIIIIIIIFHFTLKSLR